jgi:hypothetical protein
MRRALGQENSSLPSTQTAPLGATMRRQSSTPIVPLPNILIYRSYTADWPPHLASLAEARGGVRLFTRHWKSRMKHSTGTGVFEQKTATHMLDVLRKAGWQC